MTSRSTRATLGAIALSVLALGLPTAASADVEVGAGRYSTGGPTAPIGPGNRVLQTFVTPPGNPVMRDFTIGGLTPGGFVRVAIFPVDADALRTGPDVWAEPNVMVDTNGWAVAGTGNLALDPAKTYAFEVTSASPRSIGSTPMSGGDFYAGGSLFTDSGSGPLGSSFDLAWQANFGFGRFDVPFQDFGTQATGTLSAPRRFTFKNESEQDVVVARVRFDKTGDRDDFVVVGDDCAGVKLAPGEECDFGVRFAPVDNPLATNRQAQLWLETDHGRTSSVTVVGTAGALPAGPQGDPGKDGQNGADGKDGQNGQNGADGKDGLNGSNGADGKNGLNGADGQSGANGTDGKDGLNGQNGTNGLAGARGADGKDGVAGKDGAKGDAGQKGAKGDAGTKGDKGDAGEKGQKGDKGDNDVYVCTVKGVEAPRTGCYLRLTAPKAATRATVQIRRGGKVVRRVTRRVPTSGEVRLPAGLKSGHRYRVRVVYRAGARRVGTFNTTVVAR